ncbi:hypothetical protein [Schlesneria paludicola]|uniref:hypothetical protein n=1 Tax=Schlesneria paludicola TaxID=360056 RepID=UPI000492277C|nr:hypothetical protein [Schlesneria paludicola]
MLALLALLAVLGFTFFTFSSQERASAEYFASESRSLEPGLTDGIFDWPLRQILIGPDDTNLNSVLWGGRFALVPGMVGRDLVPFNGEGVNLSSTAGTGDPFVDMDFNGASDSSSLLDPVDSPAANAGVLWGAGKSLNTLPAPDVDYTYPDINNMLLAYDGAAFDASVASSRVVIPTLLRPQYLRSGGSTVSNWYDNSALLPASQSFRPHRDHYYIDTSTGNSTGVRRYVASQAEATTLGLGRPFSFAPLDANGSVTGGELGVWTASNADAINLDVDTDGDGVQESILVDLGYPPFRRGDGKLVVPLFAIQIRDLNGLINLNSATSTLTKAIVPPNISTQEFGADSLGAPRYLSSSNQGALASEINSVYGLANLPSTTSSSDLQQYRFFLTALGADRDPLSPREVANLEWFFINNGRPRFNVAAALAAASLASPSARTAAMVAAIDSVTPGILGDSEYLLSALATGTGSLPQPGRVGINDNADPANPVKYFWTNTTPEAAALGSPLDLIGGGSILATNASGLNPFAKNLRCFDRSTQPLVGSSRWLMFQGYHSNADVLLYTSPASTYGTLLMPSTTNQLTDDASELIIDPVAIRQAKLSVSGTSTRDAVDYDAVFNLSETAFLQLNNVDGALVQGSSRLADLAPVNTVVNPASAATRRQYTTISSGRREFSKVSTGLTAASSPVATQQLRNWENSYLTAVGNTPMRSVAWYLMSGYSTLQSQQFRLSANQLLVDSSGEAFPEVFSAIPPAALQFRDLTAHPSTTAVLPAAAIPTGNIPYPVSGFASPAQQEYFARRDRQAMARDLYTLLYMYCGGLDQNPLDPNPALPAPYYTAKQIKEMAQFAVNYVDSIDRDDVATRFEYDTDLRDGWGLDDNAYTTTEAQRGEVWGVEAQQLTLSEALAIKAPTVIKGGVPFNHPATEYDDKNDRFFTYIDLQNASPYSVNFATQNAWQIRVLPKGLATPATDERRLTPLLGQVAAGGTFTILSAGDATTYDQMNNPTSYLRVDPYYIDPGTPNPTIIAPAAIPALGARLDLVVDPAANYRLTDGATPPAPRVAIGELLNSVNAPDPASTTLAVIFRLMRRADPHRTPPVTGSPSEIVDEADNPWIEVDRIQLGEDATKSGLTLFSLTGTTDANTASPGSLTDLLTRLQSRVRSEPFAADFEQDFPSTQYWGNIPAPASWAPKPALKYLSNYLGQGKYDPTLASPPVPLYSQFHFDRPFAAIGELFEIPLVGPGLSMPGESWYDANEFWYFTRAQAHAKQSPANQVQLGTPNTSAVPDKRALFAAAKFLLADFPATIDATPNFDNRWYRLLEFLEISSPMNRHTDLRLYSTSQFGLPTNFGWPTTQGQLNLNTIRNPSVLAGLIDDSFVLNIQPNSLPSMDTVDTSSTGPRAYAGPRDWWIEYLRSRDGFDPITLMYTPGVANSRPFRSYSFTSRGPMSQKEDSILRILPADINVAPSGASNVQDQRHLFEIGQQGEHSIGTLDSLAKNRLLSKISNNVTTRSNSFGVFIAVQYFEAAEISSPASAIRIGGRLTDTPTKRAFFVLDRSGAVEQIKQLVANVNSNSNLVPTADQAVYPTSTFPVSVNTFSFRPNTDTTGVATNQNGIRWQDLVLYRQILN